MHLLSEGTPMTPGEVYSLLRRRRDERSAASHLPFCLQRSQADPHARTSNAAIKYYNSRPNINSSNQAAAATTAAAAAATASSSSAGVAMVRQATAMAGGGGGHGPSSFSPSASPAPTGGGGTIAASGGDLLLASPHAGHLAVLLTEVRVLRYLSHDVGIGSSSNDTRTAVKKEDAKNGGSMALGKTAAATSAGMKQLYGPSTVHEVSLATDAYNSKDSTNRTNGTENEEEADAAAAATTTTTTAATAAAVVEKVKVSSRKKKTAAAIKAESDRVKNEEAEDDDGDDTEDEDSIAKSNARVEGWMRDAITRTQTGRRSHVCAVGCALAYYESKGRRRERRWADGVRGIILQMVARGYFPPPLGGGGDAASNGNENGIGYQQQQQEEEQQQHASQTHERFSPSYVISNRNTNNQTTATSGGGGGRPLLSGPANLISMATEAAFYTTPQQQQQQQQPHEGSTAVAVAAHSRVRLLLEGELMRVVAARPRTRLQVHRLIDDLDGRLGGSAEASEFFDGAIADLFRKG